MILILLTNISIFSRWTYQFSRRTYQLFRQTFQFSLDEHINSLDKNINFVFYIVTFFKILYSFLLRGAIRKKKEKFGLLDQTGGGVWPNPNFLSNFSKTKFALELSINVMKHTLHKWGGNISSIHNVIGPPQTGKREKLGQSWDNFQARGGGFPCPNLETPQKWYIFMKNSWKIKMLRIV